MASSLFTGNYVEAEKDFSLLTFFLCLLYCITLEFLKHLCTI